MKSDEWYDRFLETLLKVYPKKAQLIEKLIELLSIERGAVYRRLRKEIPFSFYEIVKIASEWDISLDNISGIHSGKITFFMQPINYVDPSKQDLSFLKYVIQSINLLKDFPDAEFMDICNKLPRQLYAGFKHLYQFYLFKWKYEYTIDKKVIPFSKFMISKEKSLLITDYYRAIKNVPQTNFIFDRLLFDNLLSEVLYFYSIRMITCQEKELIKTDLYALLDYLWEVATNGYYPETKNKVNLYISNLNVNTNYSYTYTNQANICFVHVFDKYEIYTYHPEMVLNFKSWMQLKKRASYQISEVDEKSKIEYFSKQRKLVDTLL